MERIIGERRDINKVLSPSEDTPEMGGGVSGFRGRSSRTSERNVVPTRTVRYAVR